MRKKLAIVGFTAVLTLSTALPFIGSTAFADKGGCPNTASATGAANANANSAHGADKQLARNC